MFPTFFVVLLSSVLICMSSVRIPNIIKRNSLFYVNPFTYLL
jgi:hypothetical protein